MKSIHVTVILYPHGRFYASKNIYLNGALQDAEQLESYSAAMRELRNIERLSGQPAELEVNRYNRDICTKTAVYRWWE